MEQYNKCLLIHLWFQSNIDTQNQRINDNNNKYLVLPIQWKFSNWKNATHVEP